MLNIKSANNKLNSIATVNHSVIRYLISIYKNHIMKPILILLSFALISIKTNCQITKGNWLVSGTASFSSTKSESSTVSNTTRTYFQLQPNIGYFFIDKFAAGIKGLIQYQKTIFGSSPATKQTYYGIGPFVRYYFLPTERRVNVFSEGNYQHYISNPGSQNSNNYSVLAGTVIYLNTIVGIELTIGYYVTKYNEQNLTYKIIQAGLGLQIHLEK